MPSWWGKSSRGDKKPKKLQIGSWKSKLSSWTDDDRSNRSPAGYRSSSDNSPGSRPVSPCTQQVQAWPLPSSPFATSSQQQQNISSENTTFRKSPSLPLPLPCSDSTSSSLSSSGSDSAVVAATHLNVHQSSSSSSHHVVDEVALRPVSLRPEKSPCPSPRAILDAGDAFHYPQVLAGKESRSPNVSPVPSPRFCLSPRVQSGQVSPRHAMHPLPSPATFSLSSPRCERPPPATKTRWQKGKLLGCGSFGKVYVGFDSDDMGRMCAMKEVCIIRDDQKFKESAEQLGQEVRVLSGLRHPNIVQYYGSECLEDRLCIYLEYVSGGSIHKLLQDYGPFKKSVIKIYTKQILCGLSYLHSVKTVHRDIKGANILVDTNGTVKLADFGMAKHMTATSMPLSCKGSPYWMAPEIINQVPRCDLSVDIWSLGCTIIEMATGKPPWSEYEGVAVMFKIVNSKEPPPIPDCLSVDGMDFLRLCLQRNPADRPTAVQLLEHPFVADVHDVNMELQPASPLARAPPSPSDGHSRYVSPTGTPPRHFPFRLSDENHLKASLRRNSYGDQQVKESPFSLLDGFQGANISRMLDLRC